MKKEIKVAITLLVIIIVFFLPQMFPEILNNLLFGVEYSILIVFILLFSGPYLLKTIFEKDVNSK